MKGKANEHLEKVMEKDPLKMKRFQSPHTKTLYVVLVLAVVFFLVGMVFSWINLSSKHGATMASYNSRRSAWNSYSIADKMSDIQVGLKIMPSQNTEKNIIQMTFRNDTTEEDDDDSYQKSYFTYNETEKYFPVLRVDNNYVPAGTSETICFHLDWIKRKMRHMVDMYNNIDGFNYCENALNPKFRWQQSDPKTGVDLKVWKQTKHTLSCDSQSACVTACESGISGGIWEESTFIPPGQCYSYQVLDRVCLLIAYKEIPENATYTWEYKGGCFENDEVALYKQALKGNVYKFDNLSIEVRADSDPFVAYEKSNFNIGANMSVFAWLAFILTFLGVIGCIVFAGCYAKMHVSQRYGKLPEEQNTAAQST